MPAKSRKSELSALIMISGIVILAVFAWRTTYAIAVTSPVYGSNHEVVARKPNPHYVRFQREQRVLVALGVGLTLTGAVGVILRRARRG